MFLGSSRSHFKNWQFYTTVFNGKYLRGYLSFNGQYFLRSCDIKETKAKLFDALILGYPFVFKKKANNDTLRIISGDTTLYFILK